MKSPIFLMGFMSSGKSRLGKQLAKKLKIPFIDLDKKIEEKEGERISELFQSLGELGFRKVEAETLRELPTNERAVIALGGGTPIFQNNLKYILENGTSIYLKVEAKHLIGRLKDKSSKRPLVKNLNEKELSDFVLNTLDEREGCYMKADFILESNKPSVKEILDLLDA